MQIIFSMDVDVGRPTYIILDLMIVFPNLPTYLMNIHNF